MWFVKEDPHAKTEIACLQAEIENLVPHTPESLDGLDVGVDFHPIFCCVDGKMLNAQLDNLWMAQCPFCSATPNDMRDGIDLMTDFDTLKNLQVLPLHVLLRTGEFFFKVGFRNMAGVYKYNVEQSKEEKEKINERYIPLCS